jgi:hypothetical protein
MGNSKKLYFPLVSGTTNATNAFPHNLGNNTKSTYQMDSEGEILTGWERWKEEGLRTLAALLCFGVSAYAMSVVQILGDERMIATLEKQDVPPLPDIGLDLLPHPVWWPKAAADLTLNSFVVISLVACVISVWRHRQGMFLVLVYIRRLLWLFSFCYILRLVSLGGTTLPSSNTNCIIVKRALKDYIKTGPLILLGKAQTCTDKLFSGHTSLASLLVWFWWVVFGTKRNRFEKFVWRSYAFIHGSGVFIASMMCRHHYTVDVVLAVIISTLVFHIYHMILWVKEGYDKGHPYFSVKYGGRPAYLHDTEDSGSHLPQMQEASSYNNSMTMLKITTDDIPRYRAPLATRIVFKAVGWMEGLDIRQRR